MNANIGFKMTGHQTKVWKKSSEDAVIVGAIIEFHLNNNTSREEWVLRGCVAAHWGARTRPFSETVEWEDDQVFFLIIIVSVIHKGVSDRALHYPSDFTPALQRQSSFNSCHWGKDAETKEKLERAH